MKNISKKLITLGLSAVMTCSMSVTAFAADGDFTGDTMTGTADKYYTVSSDPTYTDVSAVKLTWKVPVLTYTSGSNKAWNTSTLRWESTAYADTTGDEVSFTLANRSSYEVKATASFALADGLDAAAATVAFTGNEVAIPSIVDGSTHALKNAGTETSSEAYITANCTKTITGKVTPDWEKLTNTAKTKLGTYTVTIKDPNAVQDVTYTLTGSNAPSGTVLKASDMLASSTVEYTYDGKTYTAYNGYISSTAYASWDDAQAFVKALNDASYDGHSDWKLLGSEAEAKAWQAVIDPQNNGVKFDGVEALWSSAYSGNDLNRWYCYYTIWGSGYKADSYSDVGFVVVRGADV